MSTLVDSLGTIKKPWQWLAIGGAVLLIWGAVAFPRFKADMTGPHSTLAEPAEQEFAQSATVNKRLALYAGRDALKAGATSGPPQMNNAVDGRKIIRTTSMSIVVQHPAEIGEQITALAESLGGYLVASDGGGQNATSGSLTIRVPAAKFEQARAAIRKLGLRVDGEKVEAQDVTRQYVDQDASIRNLRAEEAQYLSIMKQASTVKDMLAVSERLSEVRGQIEQQEAEFNALSRQIETVAIAISLRTEAEEQAFGLNWRPAYELKMAMRDGLDSVANYATAMITILFYVPSVLLWVGTILGTLIVGFKIVLWSGRRWLGWKAPEMSMAK
jgi:Uncharacterized conserved protein